ncbi:MAG TPA: hypothetical protein VMA09_12845 [Candidatus Binataceae bacterium]|nr:hypothetical protein [Candidatus Binataceae bacterium]
MAQTDDCLELVSLAAELRPLLARNATRAERDRRLPDENVEALQAANLFKMMVPCRWGVTVRRCRRSSEPWLNLAKDVPQVAGLR